MLGLGLTCITSSRSPGFRSQSVFKTDLSDSLSSVSSSLSTDNGLPAKLGRTLFLDEGVRACGNLALDIAGDVDISSSRSGDGDALRFLEEVVPDTAVTVSICAEHHDVNAYLICWERGGCVRGNEEE